MFNKTRLTHVAIFSSKAEMSGRWYIGTGLTQFLCYKDETYKVAGIHDAILHWMSAIHSVLESRLLLLTSHTFTSTLGQRLASLLCCWFLCLTSQ